MEAATQKQLETLKKVLETQGVLNPNFDGIDKAEASQLISTLLNGSPEEIEAVVRRFSGATPTSNSDAAVQGEVIQPTKIQKAPTEMTEFADLVDGRWKEEQIKLIHDTVAKGTTNAEFGLFLYQAWRLDLDPLTKEIWCVKYGNEPAAIFASFSGIQKKAMKSGEWDGYEISMDPPVLKNGEYPQSVTCTMYRKGVSHPVVFTARWAEFARYKKDGTLQSNWQSMPTIMLRKCAIANAIRQAFPDHVGSIYTPEEMPNDH